MGKLIAGIVIVLIIIMVSMFIGGWCAYNTELLASYYMEKSITLPRFPFVLGALFTQCGLPYGIITEIWCHVIDIK